MDEQEWSECMKLYYSEDETAALSLEARFRSQAEGGDPDVLALLGELKAMKGRASFRANPAAAARFFREANALLDRAVRLAPTWQRPEFGSLYALLANNCILLGEYAKGADAAAKGSALFPNDYSLAALRGTCLFENRQYEEAVRYAEELIAKCMSDEDQGLLATTDALDGMPLNTARDAHVYALRMVQGDALRALGKRAEAREAYTKARELAGPGESGLVSAKLRSCG